MNVISCAMMLQVLVVVMLLNIMLTLVLVPAMFKQPVMDEALVVLACSFISGGFACRCRSCSFQPSCLWPLTTYLIFLAAHYSVQLLQAPKMGNVSLFRAPACEALSVLSP
jgi:hypothetical protein